MTVFEPRTSGVGSDGSTNWATTTAQFSHCLLVVILKKLKLFLASLFGHETQTNLGRDHLAEKSVLHLYGVTFAYAQIGTCELAYEHL